MHKCVIRPRELQDHVSRRYIGMEDKDEERRFTCNKTSTTTRVSGLLIEFIMIFWCNLSLIGLHFEPENQHGTCFELKFLLISRKLV